MYALKNRVQLIGNVGQTPEVRVSARGIKTARFVLAINESYKNSRGDRVRDTQWHSLMVSGRLAEITEKFVEKGMEIAIEGRLINRSYTDKEGLKRTIVEIQVNEILLLGNKDLSMVEEPLVDYRVNCAESFDLSWKQFYDSYSMKTSMVADFN